MRSTQGKPEMGPMSQAVACLTAGDFGVALLELQGQERRFQATTSNPPREETESRVAH